MKAKQINQDPGGGRTFAVVFDTGDEVAARLLQLVREQKIDAAQITAIGALQDVVLGYFQIDRQEYKRIPVREQVEVVSLIGDVSLDEHGEPTVHAHLVVGRSDGTALGGHLMEGHVRPTLEVIVTESPAHLRRRHDPATGLGLIRL
jgi:predicted DNA-binding protein with PD1-like motif